VAATFEEAGYKVYEAANADEAVGLLEEFADIHALARLIHDEGDFWLASVA
jgi:hypothetical protein